MVKTSTTLISKNGKRTDITQLVSKVSVSRSLSGLSGKMDITVVNVNTYIDLGDQLIFSVDGKPFFNGYVFKKNVDGDLTEDFYVFDRLKYLNVKLWKAVNNKSLVEVLTEMFKEQGVPFKTAGKIANIKLAPRLFENVSLYKIVDTCLRDHLVVANELCTIRDDNGTIVLENMTKKTIKNMVAVGSNVYSWSLSRSIDGGTHNEIVIVKEDEKTKQKKFKVAKDDKSIKKWGKLQFTEVADNDINEAQMQDRANKLLKIYNKEVKTLKFDMEGIPDATPGCSVGVKLKKLVKEGYPETFFVKIIDVTHNFTNGEHTMSLNVEDPTQLKQNAIEAKEKDDSAGQGKGKKKAGGFSGSGGVGDRVVEAAKSKIGSNYVFGAAGESTFDCSGLVQWAYKQVNINLPRVSWDQGKAGTEIPKSNAVPGDLVFYGGHIGIYSGGNNMVHAPKPGDKVKEAPIYGSPKFIRVKGV